MDYEGEKFLLKLYRELYTKESVKHSGTISDNKYELINKYLNRLEKTERVFLSDKKEMIKYLKNRYHDKYVIKREDISSTREDTKDKIIKSQQETLDIWIDYLMTEANSYPMWARYWAFQGMLQLGRYDKGNKKFTKRSKKTTSPFIDLNKEALHESIKLVSEHLNKKPNNQDLERLIESGSFSSIYAYNISKQIERQNKENVEQGIWKEYRRNDTLKLVSDLTEKNTGWCLTSKSISKNYLEYGNIYVYYTRDKQGNYSIPRICIRLEDFSIAEIRGVLDNDSNLEYSMIDIAVDKLNDFFGKDHFNKIASDIKKLTTIYDKNKNKEELTKEELKFLYEIEEEIESFGWKKDKRIKEIINARDIKEDIGIIFNCSPEQVATKETEIFDNTLIYYGKIEYNDELKCKLPPIVIGDIFINTSEDYSKLNKLQIVIGNFFANPLTSAESLYNLRAITGRADFEQINTTKGLEKLQKVGKQLNLTKVITIEGLKSLEEVGDLELHNAKKAYGASKLRVVNGTLSIPKMIDLRGFKSLELVKKNVICYAANSLECIPNLKINGNTHFYHMINIHDIFGKQRVRKK